MLAADTRSRPFTFPALQPIWPISNDGDAPAAPGAAGLPFGYEQRLRFPRRVDRPTVIANFVSTLDGVVSYADSDAAAGGEISGFSPADRMVMGLLRAHADAVLVGAGTVRAAPHDSWTPDAIFPPAASEYARIRRREGLARQPLTVVVTGSGDLDLGHPGFSATPILIATTPDGARRLGQPPAANVEVAQMSGPSIAAAELLALLARRGVGLVLCEGGPQLLAALVGADLVDELFLTVAPQIAGRSSGVPRPGLVEGLAFHAAQAPWWQLRSVDRAGSHLFLRYGREQAGPAVARA
jgi:riboflavin biosynthesis pyrimidine reductase